MPEGQKRQFRLQHDVISIPTAGGIPETPGSFNMVEIAKEVKLAARLTTFRGVISFLRGNMKIGYSKDRVKRGSDVIHMKRKRK